MRLLHDDFSKVATHCCDDIFAVMETFVGCTKACKSKQLAHQNMGDFWWLHIVQLRRLKHSHRAVLNQKHAGQLAILWCMI